MNYVKNYLTMQDTMNSLVNALFNTGSSTALAACENEYAPRMDMKENDDAFVMKLTMPGIDANNINISVTDNVLTIKAETKEDKKEDDEKAQWLVREHSHVSYYRSVRLPSEVIADKAEAEYKNGILTLTLPKAEEVKPKTISVKVNE